MALWKHLGRDWIFGSTHFNVLTPKLNFNNRGEDVAYLIECLLSMDEVTVESPTTRKSSFVAYFLGLKSKKLKYQERSSQR